MDDFRLTAKQITKLKALHRKQRDRRLVDRLKAIVLLGSGWSVASVSQALLVDEKSVRLWLEKYRQGGETELFAIHYQGKAPSLTDEQQEQLSKHLNENTYLDQLAIDDTFVWQVGSFSKRKFSTTNITQLTRNFWLRAKASSDVERSSALNCAPLLAENFYQYQMT